MARPATPAPAPIAETVRVRYTGADGRCFGEGLFGIPGGDPLVVSAAEAARLEASGWWQIVSGAAPNPAAEE